jgi:hypothetical protein
VVHGCHSGGRKRWLKDAESCCGSGLGWIRVAARLVRRSSKTIQRWWTPPKRQLIAAPNRPFTSAGYGSHLSPHNAVSPRLPFFFEPQAFIAVISELTWRSEGEVILEIDYSSPFCSWAYFFWGLAPKSLDIQSKIWDSHQSSLLFPPPLHWRESLLGDLDL